MVQQVLGKQKYKCKNCNRQFVLNPKSNKISEETKQLIDKLLLEKISLAGIARSTQASKRWRVDQRPALCSKKQLKSRSWLAMDRQTRKIIGIFVGDRIRESTKQ
jgi:insertion element IS1 protein InsB